MSSPLNSRWHPNLFLAVFGRYLPRCLVVLLFFLGGIHPNPGPSVCQPTFTSAYQDPSASSYASNFRNPRYTYSYPVFNSNPAASHVFNNASLNPTTPSQNPEPPSQNPVPPSQNPVPPSQNPVPPSQIPVPPSQIPTPPSQSPMPPSQSPIPPPSQNPIPPPSQSSARNIPSHISQPADQTFLQYNCNGIRNSFLELNDFLHKFNIKVACIKETKLSSKAKSPVFPDYTLICKDRPTGGGGGLVILIHHSVKYSPVDVSLVALSDNTTEVFAVSAVINNTPTLTFNFYIPPSASCPPRYRPDLNSILNYSDSDTIILGDANAHHATWSSATNSGEIKSDK
jgi:hypothetical protein